MSRWNKILFGANLVTILMLMVVMASQGLPLRSSPGWEYKDIVANLLTVVTIVLAFIGLAVALAAIWGWQTISQSAAAKAAKGASDWVNDYVENEAFKSRLASLIKEQQENIQKESVQDAVVAEKGPAPEQAAKAADEEWKDD